LEIEMRNIWQIVVGCLLVVGVGIALWKGLGGDEPTPAKRTPIAASEPAAPAAGAAGQVQAQAVAPQPEATFGPIEVSADDFVLGKAEAPITIVEYASLTCPHCADFHSQVLPDLKREFIDTGKVRLVFRDFPLDRVALAGSMIAQCAGRDRYFCFLDVMFRSQTQLRGASNPGEALAQIARLGGMAQADVDACLKNEDLQKAILQKQIDGSNKYKVSSTPTLIINGRKYSGALSMPQLRAVFDAVAPASRS
jgi:protein-disulfide isomerase